MRRECRERFLRHWFQRKPLVADPGMYHGTCVTWCMSGSLIHGDGESVPGIPGAYATPNLTYLVRGPYKVLQWRMNNDSVPRNDAINRSIWVKINSLHMCCISLSSLLYVRPWKPFVPTNYRIHEFHPLLFTNWKCYSPPIWIYQHMPIIPKMIYQVSGMIWSQSCHW